MTGRRALFLRNADLLAAYNIRFNADLYRALSSFDRLSAALSDQLGHLLFMDRLWLARLGRAAPEASSGMSGEPQRAWVGDRDRWYGERQEIDTALAEFVHSLDEDRLERPIVFVTQAEQVTVRCMAWAAITQLFNHQSLHRGEILRLLAIDGVTFGNSDLLPLIVDIVSPAVTAEADAI